MDKNSPACVVFGAIHKLRRQISEPFIPLNVVYCIMYMHYAVMKTLVMHFLIIQIFEIHMNTAG